MVFQARSVVRRRLIVKSGAEPEPAVVVSILPRPVVDVNCHLSVARYDTLTLLVARSVRSVRAYELT